jgi:ribosomal peptide maturation radical SAM protein 1
MSTEIKSFALVSMPWFMAQMPSIQLAILGDILKQQGISSKSFEFYADFHDIFGESLYRTISSSNPYVADMLFTRHYFENPIPYQSIPNLGLASDEFEQDLYLFADPLIGEFLDATMRDTQWGQFDVVAFSLTASQTGASMALAKRIRAEYPNLPIIFGGASCADEMGQALMEVCSEVDVVVHKEAESVLPLLLEAMRGDRPFAEVPGITWRDSAGLHSNIDAPLHALQRTRGALRFDDYFERIDSLETLSKDVVYIPFESSRGCWYGEKAQCTFCGLNEIIKYRQRGSGGLFEELSEYADRYGVESFFAVDLIMPLSFFNSFLPQLEKSGKRWSIFYEVKSNMKRVQIEQLANAGVNWIQPGIESLDDEVLKIMRKGVSSAQNIQTLRICRELDMKVGWSIINGFPGEQAKSYWAMAALIPKLHHLEAPSNIGCFEVHRFSPYFDDPEKMGIRITGAHPRYEYVFPVDASIQDRLVYRFDFEVVAPRDEELEAATNAVRRAVRDWKRANGRGADFSIEYLSNGEALLFDSRHTAETVETRLNADEALLMKQLDELRVPNRLIVTFAEEHPEVCERMGGIEGLKSKIETWVEQSLILRESGYIQALAKVRVSSKVREFELSGQ